MNTIKKLSEVFEDLVIEEFQGTFRAFYPAQSLPLAPAVLWLKSTEPKPVVELVKVDDSKPVDYTPHDNRTCSLIKHLSMDPNLQGLWKDERIEVDSILFNYISTWKKTGFCSQLVQFLSKPRTTPYLSGSEMSLVDLYLWQVLRSQNFRWRRYSASFGPTLEEWMRLFESHNYQLLNEASQLVGADFVIAKPNTLRDSFVMETNSSLKFALRDSQKLSAVTTRSSSSLGRCSVDTINSIHPTWWHESK